MRVKNAQDHVDRLIGDIAGVQHGAISHQQLLGLGLSRQAIQRRVAAGRLLVVHRGVYAVGRKLVGSRGWWMAATLAAGDGAVLSHASAAGLWGLIAFRRPIEVTTPSRAGRSRRAGLVIHRSENLPDDETSLRDEIPVTTLARTLLDISTVFDRRRLERALDEAAYLRIYDSIGLERVIAAHPRRGARLRTCIEEHVAGSTRTNEGLEERFLLLTRSYGLPEPLVHVDIGPYEVDFLWKESMVIVETDDRSHLRTVSFERDRVKTAWLEDRGYRVRRVTWRMLETDEAGTMGSIKRLIDDRGRL